MTPGRGRDGVARMRPEGAEQDQELAHETVQTRQPDRREGHDQEEGREERHRLGQAAEVGDLAACGGARRACPRAGTGPPVERPWFTICSTPPWMPCVFRTNNPRITKPRWLTRWNRRPASSRLAGPSPPARHRGSPITESVNIQGRKRAWRRGRAAWRSGRSRTCPSSAARPPGCTLAGGRRLYVGIGKPRVEREHRHLDRESQEEGQEEPELPVSAASSVTPYQSQQVVAGLARERRGTGSREPGSPPASAGCPRRCTEKT